MFVVTRHRVAQTDLAAWLEQAKLAVAPLASAAGCKELHIGLATDEADLVSIISVWDGVGSYRRALSSFDAKMLSIPFLSTAIDEPSAYEIVHSRHGTAAADFAPARAKDADEIGLGDAASESVAHRAE